MPEKVRRVIDQNNLDWPGEFLQKLNILNDKIYVYKNLFYDNLPTHERNFLEQDQRRAERKLKA